MFHFISHADRCCYDQLIPFILGCVIVNTYCFSYHIPALLLRNVFSVFFLASLSPPPHHHLWCIDVFTTITFHATVFVCKAVVEIKLKLLEINACDMLCYNYYNFS